MLWRSLISQSLRRRAGHIDVSRFALFFGLFGWLAALAIAIDFTTVALKAHVQNGFFLNWGGQQKGEGYEFFILAVGIAVALVITGSGAWSIDRLIVRNSAGPR